MIPILLTTLVMQLYASISSEPVAVSGPTFEVASVKTNISSIGPGRNETTPRKLTFINSPLRVLLARAFDVKGYKISAPYWLNTERYDVIAAIPQGASGNDIRLMLISLLKERFHMRAHREMQERSVYSLVIDEHGSKLRALPDDIDVSQDAPVSFSNRGNLTALASLLSIFMDRPTIDKTGLQGRFDIRLDFSTEGLGGPAAQPSLPPTAVASESRASVFASLKELGLKLNSVKRRWNR